MKKIYGTTLYLGKTELETCYKCDDAICHVCQQLPQWAINLIGIGMDKQKIEEAIANHKATEVTIWDYI